METMETQIVVENLSPPISTILLCPKCGISWSADYSDYCWMRDDELIVCCCGEALCEVKELRFE